MVHAGDDAFLRIPLSLSKQNS